VEAVLAELSPKAPENLLRWKVDKLLTDFQEISGPVHGFEFRVNGAIHRVLATEAQMEAHQALCKLSEYLCREQQAKAGSMSAAAAKNPPKPATTRSIIDQLFRRGVSNEPLAARDRPIGDPTRSNLPAPTLEELRARRFIAPPPSINGPAPKGRFKHQPAVPGLNYQAPESVLPPGINRIRVSEKEIAVGFLGSAPLKFAGDEPTLKDLLARIIPSVPDKTAPAKHTVGLLARKPTGEWALSAEGKKAAKQAIQENEKALLASLGVDQKSEPCSLSVAGMPGKGAVLFLATVKPTSSESKERRVKATLSISATGLSPTETQRGSEEDIDVVPDFTERLAQICNRAIVPIPAPKVGAVAPKPSSIGPMERLARYQQERCARRDELEAKHTALALEMNATGLKAIMITNVREVDTPPPVDPSRVWPSMDNHVVQLTNDGFQVTARRGSGHAAGETSDEQLLHEALRQIKRAEELTNEQSVNAHGLARRREWVQEQRNQKQAQAMSELSGCNPVTVEFGQTLAREIGMEPTVSGSFALVADRGRLISYKDGSDVSVEVYFDGKTAVRSTSSLPGDIQYESTAAPEWIEYLTQYFADIDQQKTKEKAPERNTAGVSESAYTEYEKALAALEETKVPSSGENPPGNATLEKVTQWVVDNGLFAPMSGLPAETQRIAQEAIRAWKHIGTGSTLASGPSDVEEVPAKVFFNGRMFLAYAAHGGDEFASLVSDDEMRDLAEEAVRMEFSTVAERKQAAEKAAHELELAEVALEARKVHLLRELREREFAQSDDLSWIACSLAQKVLAVKPPEGDRNALDQAFAQVADRARIIAAVEEVKTGRSARVLFDGERFAIEALGEAPIRRVVDDEQMAAGARDYFELVDKDRAIECPSPELSPSEKDQKSEKLVPDGVTRHFATLRQGGSSSRGDYMDIVDSNGKHLSTISGAGVRWNEVTDELRSSGVVQVTIELDEITKEIKVRQITVPTKGTRDVAPSSDEDRPPINDAEIDDQMLGDGERGGSENFDLDR